MSERSEATKRRRAAASAASDVTTETVRGQLAARLLDLRDLEYNAYMYEKLLPKDGVDSLLELCWRLTDEYLAPLESEEAYPVMLGREAIIGATPFMPTFMVAQRQILLGFVSLTDGELPIIKTAPLPCWGELTDEVAGTMRSARTIQESDLIAQRVFGDYISG